MLPIRVPKALDRPGALQHPRPSLLTLGAPTCLTSLSVHLAQAQRKTRLARKAEQWLLIQLLPLTPRLQLVR